MKKLGFLLMLAAGACHSFKDQRALESAESQLSKSIFSDTLAMWQIPLSSRQSVVHFYSSRNFALFWSDGKRLTPAADSLIVLMGKADHFGLRPNDYHFGDILILRHDSLSRDRLSSIDLFLTDGFLTLHQHLRNGRLDPKTYQRLDLSTTVEAQAVASLERLHETSIARELQAAEPHALQYLLLKQALQSFEMLAKEDSVQHGRAVKIALNMERWRWQKTLPKRYVSVNIPSFILRVVENDSVWLSTSVVVGKRETPTPVLESIIRSFIIYPYWHVPHSIATKELLPLLKADASYLRRHNFDVLNKEENVIDPDTIQWSLYSPEKFPFILRQREGSENSMGIIRFNFANNHNVYLHDTNSKRLFERRRRDLSHGCVRVKDAVSFAHYLVREDDIYVSPEDLDQYLSLQQRLKIDLRKPIPLKLEYFTAEVENGITFFFDDIYKKDSLMIQALYHRSAGPLAVSSPK